MVLPVRSLLQATLDGLVGRWPVEARPLPDRQYIAAGSPQGVPWDCEQFTVAVASLPQQPVTLTGPGATGVSTRVGRQAQHGQYIRSLSVVVELVRSHPAADGEDPLPVAELHEAGLRQADDLAYLSDALVALLADPESAFRYAGCALGPAAPGGVEGGYASVTASFAVDLLGWPQ